MNIIVHLRGFETTSDGKKIHKFQTEYDETSEEFKILGVLVLERPMRFVDEPFDEKLKEFELSQNNFLDKCGKYYSKKYKCDIRLEYYWVELL